MRIIQFNVRLAEGGAASIALDLHQRAIAENYNSLFVYGYGKGGRRSESHDKISSTIKNTSVAISVINITFYKYLNYDLFGNLNQIEKKILEYTDRTIIHFHVMHSYWLNLQKLISFCERLKNKNSDIKIVWTLHDHWIITGRCAFLDGCNRWKEMCYACPTLDNYPPVKKDRAHIVLPSKRLMIKKMINLGCLFISPSQHVSNAFNSIYGGGLCQIVNNGNDLATEKIIDEINSEENLVANEKYKNRINIAIVAHDLRYDGKTNKAIISNILKNNIDTVNIHAFGKSSPFYGTNVVNRGYYTDKSKLMAELKDMDALLFTSTVDNYPLILCEVMALGIPVLALRSEAADEVLSKVGGKTFMEQEIFDLCTKDKSALIKLIYNASQEEFLIKTKLAYSGKRMLDEYVKYYKTI